MSSQMHPRQKQYKMTPFGAAATDIIMPTAVPERLWDHQVTDVVCDRMLKSGKLSHAAFKLYEGKHPKLFDILRLDFPR